MFLIAICISNIR